MIEFQQKLGRAFRVFRESSESTRPERQRPSAEQGRYSETAADDFAHLQDWQDFWLINSR